MSTHAEFYFDGKHVASKYQDGYPGGVLAELVAFLQRDGFNKVRWVFEIIPEFRSFTPFDKPEDEEEFYKQWSFVPGYGYAQLDVPHCNLEGEYVYHIYKTVLIVVKKFTGDVYSFDWRKSDAFQRAVEIMKSDYSLPPSESTLAWMEFVKTWRKEDFLDPVWDEAFFAGVPLEDIFA